MVLPDPERFAACAIFGKTADIIVEQITAVSSLFGVSGDARLRQGPGLNLANLSIPDGNPLSGKNALLKDSFKKNEL